MGKTYRLIMIATLLIIITCAWLGIKTVFIGDNDVKVPSVVGMSLREAVDRLQDEGLLAKIDEVESSEKADTVISQNIPAGEFTSTGKVLLLKVSRGGSTLPVPDVRGLKYEEAVKRLSESGFKVDKVVRVTDKFKQAGIVVAHNPSAPQTVPAGEMITLLVSNGNGAKNSFVVVPDLVGQTTDVARKVLEQSDLSMGKVTEVASSEHDEGTIVSTLPRKGANVPIGTAVAIRIAGAGVGLSSTEGMPVVEEVNKERSEAVKKIVEKDSKIEKIPTKHDKKQNEEKKVVEKKEEVKEVTKPATPEPKVKEEPKTVKPSASTKKAKIRYQVPPLTKPMPLRIEMTDGNGAKVLKEMSVNGSEYLRIDVNYVGKSIITIYLGGDFVWQDRFN